MPWFPKYDIFQQKHKNDDIIITLIGIQWDLRFPVFNGRDIIY